MGKEEKQQDKMARMSFNLTREALFNLEYVAYSKGIGINKALNQILKQINYVPLTETGQSIEKVRIRDEEIREMINKRIDPLFK